VSRYLRIYLLACIGLAFGYLLVHVNEPLRLNAGDAWADASVILWLQRHGVTVGALQLTGLRVLSLAFSGLALWMLLLYGRRMWSDTVGLIAVAFTATSLLWLMFADSLQRSSLVHATSFLTLWAIARALEDGLRRHYVAILIGSFVCLVAGPTYWVLLPVGALYTVHVKRGAPFVQGNWYALAVLAVGALAAYVVHSPFTAIPIDWRSALDDRVPATFNILLRRYAVLLSPMVWVTFVWTVWRALRAKSVRAAIEDGTTWLLLALLVSIALALPHAESAALRAQSLLPLYAIGSGILLSTWFDGGTVRRALASAACVLAPLVGFVLVFSHPREVLDRGDVSRANEFFAKNDGNSFVISNLLADGPIEAAFGRHGWSRFKDRDRTSPHLRMLELLGDTGTDYVHAVIFTTPHSRFVDRSIAQLMKGTSVDGWPYLVRAKVNRLIRAADRKVVELLDSFGAKRVLQLHNFDVYRIERAAVLERFGASLPVVQRIDFDSLDTIRHQLLGWGDPPDKEAKEPKSERPVLSKVLGFSECRNPIATTAVPTPNGCTVVTSPKGVEIVDVGWISAADLMLRVDRVCDQQITITLAAPARVSVAFNSRVVFTCGDAQWGTATISARVPRADVRAGLNILRISDKQGEAKPGAPATFPEVRSVVVEPICEAPP